MNLRDERIARWRERGAQDGIKAEQRRNVLADALARRIRRCGLKAVEAGRHADRWTAEERLGAFHAVSDGLVIVVGGGRHVLTIAGQEWLKEDRQ